MAARGALLTSSAAAVGLIGATPLPADPIPAPLLLKVANVSRAAIEPMVPICARAIDVQVEAEYANNPAVAKMITDGAQFDVVVIEARMLSELADRGRVGRASIRPLASLPMALATRDAGPYPRTATVAALRRTLLAARSIGYAGDGHSGEVFLNVVDRLKLRDKLGGRLVPFTGAYIGAAEASARLQYVVAPFFKPLPAPLRLVGRFPASLGAEVDVSAGVASTAGPAAAAFVACLRSPDARAAFTDRGYRLNR